MNTFFSPERCDLYLQIFYKGFFPADAAALASISTSHTTTQLGGRLLGRFDLRRECHLHPKQFSATTIVRLKMINLFHFIQNSAFQNVFFFPCGPLRGLKLSCWFRFGLFLPTAP